MWLFNLINEHPLGLLMGLAAAVLGLWNPVMNFMAKRKGQTGSIITGSQTNDSVPSIDALWPFFKYFAENKNTAGQSAITTAIEQMQVPLPPKPGKTAKQYVEVAEASA